MTRNNQKEINPSLNFKQKKDPENFERRNCLPQSLTKGTEKAYTIGTLTCDSQKDLCLLFTIGLVTKEEEMKFWCI